MLNFGNGHFTGRHVSPSHDYLMRQHIARAKALMLEAEGAIKLAEHHAALKEPDHG